MFQKWIMFDLKNDGLRHNTPTESCSSSHSFRLHMLHENCDVLSLKAGILSGRWHCILPRKEEKNIVANMILKYRTFPWYSCYSISIFLHGHSFFHLDNPVLDPVAMQTISNPNPKNYWYPVGLNSKIRILYTTEISWRVAWGASINVKNECPWNTRVWKLVYCNMSWCCVVVLLWDWKWANVLRCDWRLSEIILRFSLKYPVAYC